MNRSTQPTDRRRGARRTPTDRRTGSDRRAADRPDTSEPIDVTRLESQELRERIEFLTRRVTRLEAEYQIQFTRIAQMQAELDALTRKIRTAS